MPPGAFGPRAQAVIGYLTGHLGASYRDGADEAKQIDDAVDDVAGVGGSDSLVQAIPTQPINNGRVEAHEQPCSIHFGNRLLRPAAGL